MKVYQVKEKKKRRTMGKYATVAVVMLWICVVEGCPPTCKGRTCEDWFKKDDMTCIQLEMVCDNHLPV